MMTRFPQIQLGLLFSIVLTTSCSSVNTNSDKAERETGVSSVQVEMNLPDKGQNGPQEHNWKIPSPSKKKMVKKSTALIDSEDGKPTRITITDYSPVGDYYFTQAIDNNFKEGRILAGEFKLDMFREVKASKNIFWYTIFASRIDSVRRISNNSPHQHTVVYQILDKDGDGKFETLVTDDSKILVPKWAVK